MTLFVYAIDPTIRSLVAEHLERRSRVTFLELIQFARSKGNTVRGCGQQRSSTTFASTPLRKETDPPRPTTRKLLHLEPSAKSEESSLTARGNSTMAEDSMQYLYYTDHSTPTTDLTDIEPYREGEEVLAMESRWSPYRTYRLTMMSPPGGSKPTKPGWVDTQTMASPPTPLRILREGLV